MAGNSSLKRFGSRWFRVTGNPPGAEMAVLRCSIGTLAEFAGQASRQGLGSPPFARGERAGHGAPRNRTLDEEKCGLKCVPPARQTKLDMERTLTKSCFKETFRLE